MILQEIDYLAKAYRLAQEYSRDPRTQVGCILKLECGREIYGVNSFAYGVHENLDRWQKPLKYDFIEHAERNAIYEAARLGKRTEGSILYCPWFSCCDCARAVIQSGVKKVVGHNADFHGTYWRESMERSYIMLREAGVNFVRLDFKFKNIKLLCDGIEVEP